VSADAKAWTENEWWYGIHDGPCLVDDAHRKYGELLLSDLLEGIERCMKCKLAWGFRHYPEGTHEEDRIGLVGYVVGGISKGVAQ
jgi:hypothetical protein